MKPTCTEKGYTTHACTRCEDSYQDSFVSALDHRYGEWTPNADGTNSSVCRRSCGSERTADCVLFSLALTAEDGRTEFTLCPVCGEVREIRRLDADGEVIETLGGTVLALAEDAAAAALTERLPAGRLVLRMGTLESGETLLSVAFELGGKLTRPTGQVKLTLPAEMLEGYALSLIDGDGTETPIDLDIQEDEASFVLDFSDPQLPTRLIRLVPLA